MNGIAARKERQRIEREELIIEHGQRMLLRDGFQNLNLDHLAAAIEYSKGTIYRHFATKEDLALAVATQVLERRANLFERAKNFKGSSREKMRAIGFACLQFAIEHRDFFNVEMMLKSVSFWEKASPERKRLHAVQTMKMSATMLEIIESGFASGDLPQRGLTANEVCFSLIAVTIGSHIMAMQPDVQIELRITDPILAIRKNQDVICDGLGWRPLSWEHDYAATDRRVKAEIFSESTWFREG